MTRDRFDTALRNAAVVTQCSDYVRSIVRPRVHVRRTSAPVSSGRSRFGGWPDLPRGTAWPIHAGGPYRFIAQINFAEDGLPASGLPSAGLLSVFAADDESETLFWSDPGYVTTIFSPVATGLEAIRPPPDVDRGGSNGVWFSEGVAVPLARELRSDWPDERLSAALADWWRDGESRARPSPDYLLGYPTVTTLAYDPTPGPDWLPFLTLASDEELDWHWHDGGYLNVFVERARLDAADFSDLRADAS